MITFYADKNWSFTGELMDIPGFPCSDNNRAFIYGGREGSGRARLAALAADEWPQRGHAQLERNVEKKGALLLE